MGSQMRGGIGVTCGQYPSNISDPNVTVLGAKECPARSRPFSFGASCCAGGAFGPGDEMEIFNDTSGSSDQIEQIDTNGSLQGVLIRLPLWAISFDFP